ncbi:MAG: M20/M25/M40 family metallo-hydrolase [Deinococcales bacterium]
MTRTPTTTDLTTDVMNECIAQSIAYTRAHEASQMEGFFEFLRLPSISTDPAYQEDLRGAANWLCEHMLKIGFEEAYLLENKGAPIVYGECFKAPEGSPTIMIYAHYDVQPVKPLSRWYYDPFEPTVIDGKIYARGAVDDKCGVYFNLKAIESMLEATGQLPVNIKVFFEGEEESGSPNMSHAIAQYRDKLKADLLIVSDGGSAPEQPYITSGVRGIISAEIEIKGPKKDLHSGRFGGVVHNPVHQLSKIIASLHDEAGWVQIPGFYDDVLPVSTEERAALALQSEGLMSYQQEVAGVKAFLGIGTAFLERISHQPTCDVNGIYGGYQGDGTMTIIPTSAGCKITMRLVANQDPLISPRSSSALLKAFAQRL